MFRSRGLVDLVSELPRNEPRFIIYEHEYVTQDKRPTDKLYFIIWGPPACAPALNMSYSHARPNLRAVCEGCYDLAVSSEEDLMRKVNIDTNPKGHEDNEGEDDDDWLDA